MEQKLDELEQKITVIMRDALSLGFDYAFCDNEEDIEYSIGEILEQNKMYSILVYRKNGETISKCSSWKIDGLTNR